MTAWIDLSYLLAACLFVLGLKLLASPRTAAAGNRMAAVGMLIAVGVTLLDRGIVKWDGIVFGIAVGSVAGILAATRVQMTAMPQMVALFNGFGGAASALVAAAQLLFVAPGELTPVALITIAASMLIGAVTLTGSVTAYAKLQGLIGGAPVLFPLQKPLNALLLLAALGLSAVLIADPGRIDAFVALAAVSSVLGVLAVIPIGGADMPVVISLLNAYSGMAACTTGFVLDNKLLIVAGSLVGSSGIILTAIMCKAMNRSLANVLFAGVGAIDVKAAAGATERRGSVRGYSAEDAAMVLENASRVLVVPGYGLAVAQAQHSVRELGEVLRKRGAEVIYAIHPVAGRMPGHMNVLLAEANVPYEQLYDLDQANPEFERSDVALVIGANDVTNPAARHDRQSPIYGMPILDVDKARAVMFCKRSMGAGFAGVDNELFYDPKTMMLFGDAKATVDSLIRALK